MRWSLQKKRDPTMNRRSLRTCGTSSPSGVTPSLWSYPSEYRITRVGDFPTWAPTDSLLSLAPGTLNIVQVFRNAILPFRAARSSGNSRDRSPSLYSEIETWCEQSILVVLLLAVSFSGSFYPCYPIRIPCFGLKNSLFLKLGNSA